MIQRDLSHPFDRGYWARIDQLPRPADEAEAAGWDEAEGELNPPALPKEDGEDE